MVAEIVYLVLRGKQKVIINRLQKTIIRGDSSDRVL